MESRRSGEGAAPRALRSEEARGLPQDLRGRRLQDLDPRGAGDQAAEGEAARSKEERSRGGLQPPLSDSRSPWQRNQVVDDCRGNLSRSTSFEGPMVPFP